MVTRQLAQLALDYRHEALPAEVRDMAMRCILDGIACALAGRDDAGTVIVDQEVREQGGKAEATILGTMTQVPASQAALVNGTATHALDYDDVNVAIPGHATAVVMPAVLALAETTGASGAAVVTAFVAGYEVACRVGLLVAPGHYDRGFHTTATAGAIGAAAACGRLLDLSPDRMASALSLAATQASGLKAMFGNMAKPLHAGLAARNGVMAARLVSRGFDAGTDAIEHRQGFARALSPDFHPEAIVPAAHFHILRNLFKYHAACYGTHSVIEGANRLRIENGLAAAAVKSVTVTANPASDKYCNIAAPRNANEGKFSLRLNAALGLLGVDTSRLDAYSDTTVADKDAALLRDRVEVRFDASLSMMKATVAVETLDGRRYSTTHDAGEPESDLRLQARRVGAKFIALVEPLMGCVAAERLSAAIRGLEGSPGVDDIFIGARRG